MWKIVILVLLIIFSIVFLIIGNKYEFFLKDRVKVSEKIYGEKFPLCRSITDTASYGILTDASIVCNLLKDIQKTPYFYYERFPNNLEPNSWLFPNLDTTDFRQLYKNNSPKVLLCKTKQTFNILSQLFPDKKVIYTGFTSFDKYLPNIKKCYNKFIHIAGKSPYKGSEFVLKTWVHHPEWPDLVIVTRDSIEKRMERILRDIEDVNNVELITNYLPEDELWKLSNEFGVHICSSEHEGFGHYIHDAKSTKAVVLYTDAPCMNETFVDGVNGIAIDCNVSGSYNSGICPKYKITKRGLEKAINKVLQLSQFNPEILYQIGENARRSYLEEKRNFEDRLKNVVKMN